MRRVAGILGERARPRDERQRSVQAPGVERRLGGAAQAPAPRGFVLGEVGRALVRDRRRGVRRPRDRLRRRCLELAGERLVGAVGHHRAMPRAAHGVAHRRGKRLVGFAALAARRRAVDRGTHEGMTEGHRAVDAHELLALGIVEVRERQPEPLGSALHRGDVARLVGRGQQQHAARGVRQVCHARAEGGLDGAAHRWRPDDRLHAVELCRAERRGQLEQRERIAVGGPQKPLDDVGRDPAIQASAEQGVGVLRVQAVDLELGQPRRIEATRIAGARGHEQRDRLGFEAPRGEHERLGRRGVQPLGVVDAAQHRATVAGLGQQAQQAGADEKAILDAVEAEAQRAAQSRGLGGGEAIDELQARAHELVHAGEGQLVLGLDADAAQHRHVARAVGGVLEQRGLADPRLAAQHERDTALAACAPKERIEGGPLGLTPDEHLVAILIPTHVGGDWGGGLGSRPIRPRPGRP